MNGQAFLDELRDGHETELSRLGSSKAVYALTEGEMEGDAVRAATARELQAIAPVIEEWAEATDGDAESLFADVAAFAADTAHTLEEGTTVPEGEEGGQITAAALSLCDDDVPRTAGLVAALLVLGTLSGQLVGFFVGDADRAGADEFRKIRDQIQTHRVEAAAHLETTCSDESDWAAAQDAAGAVVETAYDRYVDTLEGMGVEPKNVC